MGRSAGGGGGCSSGGGSSRSSSSHRHSSSSRSSGGSSNSSHSSYSGSGGGFIDNRYYNHRGGGYYGGTFDRVQTTVAQWMIIFVFISIMALAVGICVAVNNSKHAVPYSTIQREALDKSNVNVTTDYYEDNLDWFVSGKKVKTAMEYFFNKTGVQPYLIITDNIDGNTWPTHDEVEDYLNMVYNSKFTDEQHMILIYLDNGSQWLTQTLCGKTSKLVMDEEANEIILSYFDYYATSDLDDDDYFYTSFKKSADRIMSFGKLDNRLLYVGSGILVLVLFGAIVFILIKHKEKVKKLKVDELKAAEEILKVNISGSDLKDKYKEGK